MRTVCLHWMLKNFFAVFEDCVPRWLSEDLRRFLLGIVSSVAVYFRSLAVYSCLNGWCWFLGLRSQGTEKVLGKLRRLGGRERLGLDGYGGLRQPGRLTRNYR